MLSVEYLFYVFVFSGLTSVWCSQKTQWPGEVPLLRENYVNLKRIHHSKTIWRGKDDQKVGSNALSLCNSRVLMVLGFRVNCFYFKKQSLLLGTKTLAWLVITRSLCSQRKFQISHHTCKSDILCTIIISFPQWSVQCSVAPLLFHLTFRTQGHKFTRIFYLTDTLYSVQ